MIPSPGSGPGTHQTAPQATLMDNTNMSGPDQASEPAGDAPVTELSAVLLRRGLTTASDWLSHNASAIDAINVFPVPDGDTGSNMALTLRSAVAEFDLLPDDAPVPDVLAACARGALMGARGNSGVILSQWLRGLAEGVANGPASTAALNAGASQAAATARSAIAEPRGGTILSVSDALSKQGDGNSILAWMEDVLERAQEAVAQTPDQLPILREAGVVDAGALGLSTLLEGLLWGLRGDPLPAKSREAGEIDPQWMMEAGAGLAESSGFCTEFIVDNLGPDATVDNAALRRSMEALGESVLVVGDRQMAHVHLHTSDPATAFAAGASFGRVSEGKADDLAAQHAVLQPGAGLAEIAVVAVAYGDGYIDQFRSLGVSVIVPGGQTMNPSAAAILRAAQTTHAREVLVLPNNINILPAAEQAAQLAGADEPRLHIVRTRSQPAGVAALTALIQGASAEANAATMTEAATSLLTGAVTYAARSVAEPVRLVQGQPFALLESEIIAAAEAPDDALYLLVGKMLAQAPSASLLTLYQGGGVSANASEAAVERIRQAVPAGVEIELVIGGQPHYPWEVSLE